MIAAQNGGKSDVFSLTAVDVTGSFEVEAQPQPALPAGVVARALAARLSLPDNVPWGLHDGEGTFLQDDVPISEQIESGAKVTVVPKAHLG